MNKGFIFSIEALAAITILLFAIVLIGQPIITGPNNNYTIIQNQNDRAIAIYTQEFPTIQNNLNRYCGTIVYNNLGLISEKGICEGYS